MRYQPQRFRLYYVRHWASPAQRGRRARYLLAVALVLAMALSSILG
ncbi:hypothetical protein [Hymenobacter saemangeumensis]